MSAPASSVYMVFALLCVGLVMGSFLGTLVLRLPQGRPVLFARSQCASCGQVLTPLQLVPIFSWLMHRGSCANCGARISLFYPAMELAAAGVAVWAAQYVQGVALWLTLALGWTLLALAVMDVRTFRLSDALTLPLIAGGILAAWLLEPSRLFDHLLGAATGWLGFVLVDYLYRLVRHRRGIGLGDAKLLAAGGAWLGWQGLGSVLLIASFSALLVILVMHLAGRRMRAQTPLAFGAFLSLGIWIVWLYGPVIAK
jgi:leader peptidase (prepilin peptidase)/N-methyltransferase